MRGTHADGRFGRVVAGIIPAYAGNTHSNRFGNFTLGIIPAYAGNTAVRQRV